MKNWHSNYRCFKIAEDGLPMVFHDLPNTSVMTFIHGLSFLETHQRAKAVKIVVAYANDYMLSVIGPTDHAQPQKHAVFQEVDSIGSAHTDLKQISLKLLKQLVGCMKSDKPRARQMLGDCPVDPELIKYADTLELVSASEMRKRFKAYLFDQFNLKPDNQGAGIWEYRSSNSELGLEINYGGTWGQQIRYRILHPKLQGLSLETMWGVGVGDWDYIHDKNFEKSMNLLGSIYSFFDNILMNETGAIQAQKQND